MSPLSDEGNGEKYVFRQEFETFTKGNANLCKSYRSALEDKVNGMEKAIVSQIKLVGTMTALFISVVQLAIRIFMG